MSDQNVKTVQTIYGAFGRGDLPGILALVSDDTEWGFNGASSAVPWHPTARGKAELPRFFQAMNEHMEMHDFRPQAFIHSGDDVICHLALEYTVKKTGKRVKEEQLQWWSFKDGKVARLTHFEDTAQVIAANK